MGEIMNSPKGVKSSVLEIVSISCPTCGTHHDLHQLTGNQSYVTVNYYYYYYFHEEYPCFNSFEIRIDFLIRKSSKIKYIYTTMR